MRGQHDRRQQRREGEGEVGQRASPAPRPSRARAEASRPSATPSARPMPTAITPTRMEFCAPDQQQRGDVAARGCRCRASGCAEGAASLFGHVDLGRRIGRPEPATAARRRRAAAAPARRRRRSCGWRAAPAARAAAHASLRPQPRVDHRVEHVDHEVDDDHASPASSITTSRTTTRSRLAIAWNTSRPRPGRHEHVLDDDRAGEQVGELQPHDGEHRDHRVAQHVAPQRRRAGSGPWRARCARSPRAAPRAPPSA